ncbi:YEATS domain-containing protein 2-like isoform X2 [Dendronephthya gigantea]|nr:YEATS domain-containing protein 2-like isoform X2 [Dendronephthya gigantea]
MTTTCNVSEANVDPDYETLQEESVGEVNESLQREDARDQTVQKIQDIIHEQFSFEINLKEKEVSTLNSRVHECRTNLDRLRACILAGYYGYGTPPQSARQVGARTGKTRNSTLKEASLHEIMNWKKSLPPNIKEQPTDQNLSNPDCTKKDLTKTSNPTPRDIDSLNLFECSKRESFDNESRFYVKRRIIIGNTSKYILPEQRERNDRSTHKWMVYVRGPKDGSELNNFISKVWFLLHPSYQPNDLVEVCKPPFQVTRRGWGEFPVRVQLHFVENKNKRVDIIHHLKLDKSYTGLQTLGAETHVDIELDRKNFDGLSMSKSLVEDTNRKNITSSSQVLPTNLCSVRESAAPVSSKCFELPPVENVTAVDSGSPKEVGTVKYGSNPDHGIFCDHSYSSIGTEEKTSTEHDMKYPTPPTSANGSRCSSPRKDPKLTESFSVEADIEQESLLRKSIEQFPVITAEKNFNTPGYCASSLEQFFSWTIGKRLAAEWQRALAIKAHIKKQKALRLRLENEVLGLEAQVKEESHALSLSTKDVMNYCRTHGYTPMMVDALSEGETLCKFCGEEVDESECDEDGRPMLAHEECVSEFEEDDVSGTYTTAKSFLEILSKSEATSVKQDERKIDDDVIDVVGVTHKIVTRDPSKPRLFFLPVTVEHEWVQEIAQEVNVSLTNSDIDGVHAPVTSAMLFKACAMFVEDIVRKANRFTWKSTMHIPKAKCILPSHVKQAVDAIPHCDFLTNKNMKVDVDTPDD